MPRMPQASPGLQGNALLPASLSFNNGVRLNFPETSTRVHIGALIQQDWVFPSEDSDLRAAPSIGRGRAMSAQSWGTSRSSTVLRSAS